MIRDNNKRICVTLPKDLMQKVEEASEIEEISASKYIGKLVKLQYGLLEEKEAILYIKMINDYYK